MTVSSGNPHTARKLRGLGETIARQRRVLGLSQQQLAGKVGVSRQTIARLETGHGINTATLALVAGTLDLTLTIQKEHRLDAGPRHWTDNL